MNLLMNVATKMTNVINFNTTLKTSSAVATKINEILRVWIGPLFTAIGAVGAVYIIILAVQYAKSENDSKRAEVKSRMVNCIIGVLCLLVIGTICLTVDWLAIANIFSYASSK